MLYVDTENELTQRSNIFVVCALHRERPELSLLRQRCLILFVGSRLLRRIRSIQGRYPPIFDLKCGIHRNATRLGSSHALLQTQRRRTTHLHAARDPTAVSEPVHDESGIKVTIPFIDDE